jgi:molybdenum cofactor biosynthesis enzyme MoaA
MITKADLHRIRYTIDTLAYKTFDENTGPQRGALNELLAEIDRLIKKADTEFEEE